MKHLIYSMLMVTLLLNANSVEIMYANATLSIDGNSSTYKKGEKLELTYDTEVCLLKGDGAGVEITLESGDSELLMLTAKKRKDCVILKKQKIEELSLWATLKEKVDTFFGKSKDEPISGTSMKSK